LSTGVFNLILQVFDKQASMEQDKPDQPDSEEAIEIDAPEEEVATEEEAQAEPEVEAPQPIQVPQPGSVAAHQFNANIPPVN
jgi:hypothetical protein